MFFFLFASVTQYRVGGIDTEKLWEHLPKLEVSKYDSILKSYQDSLSNENVKLQKTINTEAEKMLVCNAGAGPLSDSGRFAIRQKLIQMVQKVLDFESSIQKLIEQKSNQLRTHIYNKIKEQIKPIFFELGYDIIIDICANRMFPLPHCNDITELVLEKLGWKQ